MLRPVRQSTPPVAKGRVFPFQVSASCWVDLLGYGSQIGAGNFNPLHPKSAEAIKRLHKFHATIANHSHRIFPALVLNDGAVIYRDLSLRSRSVTHDFLIRCWNLHQDIVALEASSGFPGARMVLSVGFRVRRRRRPSASPHLESLLERFRDQRITAEQAIREAARSRSFLDIVPELQGNFSFTKAYLADQSGSAAGLAGPRFFVDLALFTKPAPPWLSLGPSVRWSHGRLPLSAEFAPINGVLEVKHPEGGPVEVRDALQIAQHLTNDTAVLDTLRAARHNDQQ